MGIKCSVRPAKPEDALAIACALRGSETAELKAAGVKSPWASIYRSILVSREAYVGEIDDVPACVYGVLCKGLLVGPAHPWFYGTGVLSSGAAVPVLRACRRGIEDLASRYPVMTNWVDVRNARAIQWLRWMGFRVSDDVVSFPSLPGEFHPYRYEARQ